VRIGGAIVAQAAYGTTTQTASASNTASLRRRPSAMT
jgi:hypothetical protein